MGLAALPSVALWMAISPRIGPTCAFALACLVEAAGVALSVLWVATPGLVLASIGLGTTFLAITALGFVVVRGLVAGDQRPAMAIMTAAFGIGPSFAGVLVDTTGDFRAATLTASAALLTAAALTFTLNWDPANG